MSLITCPECGHSVSNMAISCPSCGYPMNLSTTSKLAKIGQIRKPRKKHKNCLTNLVLSKSFPGTAVNPTLLIRLL